MNHEQKTDNRRSPRPEVRRIYVDWEEDEDEDPEWEDRNRRRKARNNKFRDRDES